MQMLKMMLTQTLGAKLKFILRLDNDAALPLLMPIWKVTLMLMFILIDADSESSEWFSVSNCQSYDVYRASKKGHGANQHHLENLHFVFPTYIIYIYIYYIFLVNRHC